MKQVFKIFYLALFSTFLFSCSSDNSNNDSQSTFKVNYEKFKLQPTSSIIVLTQDYPTENMIRTNFSITGSKGTSEIATVSFDLFRKPTESLSGVYDIVNVDQATSDDIVEYVQTNGRGCLGWTSALQIVQVSNQNQTFANNPSSPSTITITDNGNNSYSILFDGNYRMYDNDFNIIGTIPVFMDITGTAFSN